MPIADYKQFLQSEFAARARRNPNYSLRAYARDLAVPASKLSEVLRGVRRFSPASVAKIAERLGLEGAEKIYFVALANSAQTRNLAARKRAEGKLARISQTDEYGQIALDQFRIIADWHHFAILELTEVKDFDARPAAISNRLGISEAQAQAAVDLLLDAGLLARTASGGLKQTKQNLATPSGVPSRYIREHHSQVILKAEAAVHAVPVEERDLAALTLAFDSSQMAEVREELKKLRRRLAKKIQDRPAKDRVYCLAVQFFPLDLVNKNNRSNR